MKKQKTLAKKPLNKSDLIKQLRTTERKMSLLKARLKKATHNNGQIENQKKYRTLFENAPVGIVMLDKNDRILQINKTFETIFQFRTKEIRGKHLNDVLVPESMRAEANKLSSDTSQKLTVDKETWRKRKDGTLVPVQILGVPIEINHDLIGIYGMYADITERTRAQEKLKKLNRIYEVTSNINSIIVHTNDQESLFKEVCRVAVEDGKFRMAAIGLIEHESQCIKFVSHHGFTGDFLASLNINLADEINHNHPAAVAIETMEYCVSNNIENDLRMERWRNITLKNGFQSLCVFPLIVFEKPYGLIYLCSDQKFFFDEYEIKLLDEMTMDVSFCIEKIFNEGKREKNESDLLQARTKAEEANRLKNSFLARMSHEVRTPINVILGNVNAINELYYKSADEETKLLFDSVEEECLRLLTTMTEIFDISSIESGNFKISIEPLSLNSIVKTICQNLKTMAHKKNLNVTLDCADTDIIIKGDEYCLRSVAINILHNAIKFSNHGTIKISVTKKDGFGICSIADEGVGMTEEYQKQLFEIFSQEDVGYSRAFEGTGLGLALVKKYVEFMNGDIQISSKKDVGTIVTFKIPLS